MAIAVSCYWCQGAVCEKCTENASLSTLLHCSALTPPILMEKCWPDAFSVHVFANSTLTSIAAYSYSLKVPQTWAEGPSIFWNSFPFDERSSRMLWLHFRIVFRLYTTNANQNLKARPLRTNWLAPAVMQPKLVFAVFKKKSNLNFVA